MKAMTNLILTLEIGYWTDVYQTTQSKPKSDVILLKMNCGDTRMKFQVANEEVISSMGVAHVTKQMYGYMFNLLIFICDLGEIDCIFGLDAGKEAGFITCARMDRIWFNANEHDEPKQMSKSNSNAICNLRAVKRIELKQFKATN